MKKILLALAVFAAGSAWADVYVQGYFRHDGTYVQPHYRSDPDGNPYNNFSTRGNINPYTGRPGTVNPYMQADDSTPSYSAPVHTPYLMPGTPVCGFARNGTYTCR